jgi:hypothetical protein
VGRLQQVAAKWLSHADPIPEDLRHAFHHAVVLFADWDRGGPEPQVSLEQQPYPISSVCSWVMKFNDRMPENVQHVLANIRGLTIDLTDPSYGTAARSLLRAINDRKAEYRQRREL